MQSMLQFILGAIALIRSVLQEADVLAYLAGRKSLLDPAPQGLQVGEAAERQQEERDLEASDKSALTNRIVSEHAALVVEVHDFEFAAKRDLAQAPALARKLGIKLPRRHRKAAKADAQGAQKPAAVPEKGAEGKARRHRIPKLVRFLFRAKRLVRKALAEPGVISAMTPHGYTEEELTALQERLEALDEMSKDQGVAKKSARAATVQVHGSVKEFGAWFTPWKRRLTHALKDREDLRIKLGLSAPARGASSAKSDARHGKGKPPHQARPAEEKPPAPEPPTPPSPPKAT